MRGEIIGAIADIVINQERENATGVRQPLNRRGVPMKTYHFTFSGTMTHVFYAQYHRVLVLRDARLNPPEPFPHIGKIEFGENDFTVASVQDTFGAVVPSHEKYSIQVPSSGYGMVLTKDGNQPPGTSQADAENFEILVPHLASLAPPFTLLSNVTNPYPITAAAVDQPIAMYIDLPAGSLIAFPMEALAKLDTYHQRPWVNSVSYEVTLEDTAMLRVRRSNVWHTLVPAGDSVRLWIENMPPDHGNAEHFVLHYQLSEEPVPGSAPMPHDAQQPDSPIGEQPDYNVPGCSNTQWP